jgi:hypothetical protein
MLMTVRKTIIPGAMAKTGWVRMKAWASLRRLPQEEVGGWTPKPR